jgi:hypothetical protein
MVQSIRSQSGRITAGQSYKTWSCRENLPTVRRNCSRQKPKPDVGGEVEDDWHRKPDVVDGDGLGVQVKEGGGLMHLQVGGVWGRVEDVGRLLVVVVLGVGSAAAARARAAWMR